MHSLHTPPALHLRIPPHSHLTPMAVSPKSSRFIEQDEHIPPTSASAAGSASVYPRTAHLDRHRVRTRLAQWSEVMRTPISPGTAHSPEVFAGFQIAPVGSGPFHPPTSSQGVTRHVDQAMNTRVPGGSMAFRRASRFDPMGDALEDSAEDGYGDLGNRHPLRRVKEEDDKEEGISLPSIKSLFEAADRPRETSSASSSQINSTPTLPPVVPPSPSSSPSTAYRSSRYSSMGSSFSTISENGNGWWAPDFERGGPSSAGPSGASPFLPSIPRAHSFPSAVLLDDREAKRRRSDQPTSFADSEEAARLRWQAQSRNASFPLSASISAASGSPLRSLMAPPSVTESAGMSRGSVSHSSIPFSPLASDDTPMRPPAVSRSASVVGGQLARTFADLTAEDHGAGSRSSPSAMGPPILPSPLQSPDRRSSLFPPPPVSTSSSLSPSHPDDARKTLPSPLRLSMTEASLRPSTAFLPPRQTRTPEIPRRQVVTRPSSPARAPIRRSSLTEIIKAKTGDDLMQSPAHITTFAETSGIGDTVAEPPFLSWRPLVRRESAASVSSADGPVSSDTHITSSQRGRKRESREDLGGPEPVPVTATMDGRPGASGSGSGVSYGGMEVLAESARRVSEADLGGDGDLDDREQSPDRGLAGPKYACSYCSKTFSRPSSLRIHTYSHTGERPFICPEPTCRRRFSVQSNLKRHAKVHQLAIAAIGLPHHHQHLHHHQPYATPHVPPGPPSSQGPLFRPHPPSYTFDPPGAMHLGTQIGYPGPPPAGHPHNQHFQPGPSHPAHPAHDPYRPSSGSQYGHGHGHAPGPVAHAAGSHMRESGRPHWSEDEGEEVDELDEE